MQHIFPLPNIHLTLLYCSALRVLPAAVAAALVAASCRTQLAGFAWLSYRIMHIRHPSAHISYSPLSLNCVCFIFGSSFPITKQSMFDQPQEIRGVLVMGLLPMPIESQISPTTSIRLLYRGMFTHSSEVDLYLLSLRLRDGRDRVVCHCCVVVWRVRCDPTGSTSETMAYSISFHIFTYLVHQLSQTHAD